MCASALAAAASGAATPLSAAVGAARRVEALRDPDPRIRARAGWWLAAHAPAARAGSTGHRDPRPELPLVIAHERDPAAALAEVAALSRWTRGTLEHGHRLLEVANAPLVPEVARRAALRAFALSADEDRLAALLARATTLAPADPAAELATLGLAALPDALLSAALQRTAGQPSRRAGVIRALGLRGDPRWAEAVINALRAPRDPALEPVLAQAVEAAASLRLTEAAPELVALAEDPRARSVRAMAVRALGSFGGAFDPAVLARCAEVPLTRVAALESAAGVGDPRLAAVCARHLDAPLAADRVASARCLGALGEHAPLRARRAREPDPAVLDAIEDELEPAVRDTDTRSTHALIAALARTDREADRVRIALALGVRAGRDAVAAESLAALVARERDLPSPAAVAALRALVTHDIAVDDDALAAWIRAADPVARQAAAHAVGVLGGSASAAALRSATAAEPDDDARGAMVLALARVDGSAAMSVVELVDETAFSPAQVAMVAHARRVMPAEVSRRRPFVARGARRIREVAPDSVWVVTLPDGGVAVAVASEEGALRVPEGAGALRAPQRTEVR